MTLRPAFRTRIVWILLLTCRTMGAEWHPPQVVTSRRELETAYPRQTVSASALDIERLSARLGIDAAPQGPAMPDPNDEDGFIRQIPNDGRERPDREVVARMQPGIAAVSQWVSRELSEAPEAIGPPPEPAARFLEANAGTIDSIVALATKPSPIDWDLDVTSGSEAPMPNLLGLTRLQKILAGKALQLARAGEPEAALEAVEAMWRISESLAARPELISQLVVAAQLRLTAGLLRKIPGPSFGWETRLRDLDFFDAFLAALQNDPWHAPSEPEIAPTIEIMARIYRRFVDSLVRSDACAWTKESLQRSWDVAASGENGVEQILIGISSESINDMLLRWRSVLLDSEFTVLVLQAKGEKAASRKGEWPPGLPDLESSVCPRSFYSYRRNGGVAMAFEGRIPVDERGGFALPWVFRGAPPPTPTRTPIPTPATPTPTPGAR